MWVTIVFEILRILGVGAAVAGLFFWLFKKYLSRRIDHIFDEQLAEFKHKQDTEIQ